MDILVFNSGWMLWNIFLAIVGVVFGVMMVKNPLNLLKTVSFFFWLVFVPNTIYLLTDLAHFFEQYQHISSFFLPFLILQYLFLIYSGVLTFLVSVSCLEKLLKNFRLSNITVYTIITGFIFLISVGVMMGRFQRTNSWTLFTSPLQVFSDLLTTLLSVNQMVFVLFFGFFCTILYFGLRKKLRFMKSI